MKSDQFQKRANLELNFFFEKKFIYRHSTQKIPIQQFSLFFLFHPNFFLRFFLSPVFNIHRTPSNPLVFQLRRPLVEVEWDLHTVR